MQITKKSLKPTKIELTVSGDAELYASVKERVLKALASNVSLAGFRKGHAPLALVEKNVDTSVLQKNFIDEAVNELYSVAVQKEKLRVVGNPEVSISKFVPFTELEIKVLTDVVGDIKLADYKKFRFKKQLEKTTAKDVDAVMQDLLARDAKRSSVDRAAKDGDEVVMDFSGVDAKTKVAIEGARATDYPLVLGSGTFIPGFEPELVGLKKGDKKSFDITFPKDYGAAVLQSKKVNFSVEVKDVKEVTLPKADDEFAKKLGQFKSLAELKADIKKQVESEKDNQAQRSVENQVLQELAQKSKMEVPEVLVADEMKRMEEEERRNLMYRGVSWPDHLKAAGKTEEEYRVGYKDEAVLRIKTGLALGEVAETEGIQVSEEELQARMELLHAQYGTDGKMKEELEKPESLRDIASRILTEKTIAKLLSYATQ